MARLLLACVLLLTAFGALAERGVDLYGVETLVTSRSDATRERAAREYLGQVVVRMSGDGEAREHPAVRQAMGRAERYLHEYSYHSTDETLVVDGRERPATRLALRYSPDAVEQLLRRAGLSLWPANRPALLVWLVQDTGQGPQLVDDDSLREQLRQRAEERGLPLILPLLDLEDRLAVDEEHLWRFQEDEIRSASSRYRPDAILVGRYSRTTGGDWRSNWQLYHSQGNPMFEGEADADTELVLSALDATADHFASLYAIVPQDEVPDTVVMQVANVDGFAAFKQLQTYLGDLAVVRRVDMVAAHRDSLLLRLHLEGDQQRLISALALDEELVPWREAGRVSLPGDRYQPRGTLVNPLVYSWADGS